MAGKLAHYNSPAPLRSNLFKNPPDGVPPTDELEALHAELKIIKQRTIEKAKKAGEDLKVLEESMRRMKEKEKGKAKAVEKIKRERDFTPLPDADDGKPLALSAGKPRMSSHPLNSVAPSSSRSSLDPRGAGEEKKKKKKRKRDLEDSDIEMVDGPRPHKATPPLAHSLPLNLTIIPPPAKAAKSISSSSASHSKPHTGPDFSVPPSAYLLPPRPPIPPPPIPGPSKPTDVSEDFSKLKQPPQTAVTTFYTSIEQYLRPVREEDLGFLEYTGDEVEPYVMPKLGRHYLDAWEEQDRMNMQTYPAGEVPSSEPPFSAPLPNWDPSTLAEPDLQVEGKGHGPLTERLISALLPMENNTWKGVKAAEDAMEGRPGGSGAAASKKEKMNVSDLEVRIRDTMRYHELIDGVPDYIEKVDDPIATALRQAQSELRHVVATNKARRARYAAVARDRLAHQEYLELRDSIDRNISHTYTKLQKRDAPKLGRKKKKSDVANGSSDMNGSMDGSVPPPLPPCPAALGLGPDEENRLVVADPLKQLVQTRANWVQLGQVLAEHKEVPNPGRLVGFPKESIFRGIEDEVEQMLAEQAQFEAKAHQAKSAANGLTASNSASTFTSATASASSSSTQIDAPVGYAKGKGKARDENAMDVG